MSRIIQVGYQQALERVNSRSKAHDRVANTPSRFAEILADIEKKAEKPRPESEKKPEGLAGTSANQQNGYITNLRIDELDVAPTQAWPITREPSEQTASAASGVKSPAIPVKIAPAVVLTVSEEPELKKVAFTPSAVSQPYLNLKPIAPKTALEDDLGGTAVKDIISMAGRYHGLDPHLALAVAKAESSFNAKAVSSDGFFSKGLFQLLDSTARDMSKRLGSPDKYRPFDPKSNSHLGVGYLRYLHDIFSRETDLGSKLKTVPAKSAADLENIAVAAFNVGEGAVAEAQASAKARALNPGSFAAIKRFLPSTTNKYVARVSDYKVDFDQSTKQIRSS